MTLAIAARVVCGRESCSQYEQEQVEEQVLYPSPWAHTLKTCNAGCLLDTMHPMQCHKTCVAIQVKHVASMNIAWLEGVNVSTIMQPGSASESGLVSEGTSTAVMGSARRNSLSRCLSHLLMP